MKKIYVYTLETQMSKHREDFRKKGNPNIRIKTAVRTWLKKSFFLVNTVDNLFVNRTEVWSLHQSAMMWDRAHLSLPEKQRNYVYLFLLISIPLNYFAGFKTRHFLPSQLWPAGWPGTFCSTILFSPIYLGFSPNLWFLPHTHWSTCLLSVKLNILSPSIFSITQLQSIAMGSIF